MDLIYIYMPSGFLVVEFSGSLLRLEEPPRELDLHGLRQSLAPLVGFSAAELILTSSDGNKEYRRMPSDEERRLSRRDQPFRLTASSLCCTCSCCFVCVCVVCVV